MGTKGTIRLIVVTAAIVVALLLIWRPWQARTGLPPPLYNSDACTDVASRDSKPVAPKTSAPANQPTKAPGATPEKPPVEVDKPTVDPPKDPPKETSKDSPVKPENDEALIDSVAKEEDWREVDSRGRLTGKWESFAPDSPVPAGEREYRMTIHGRTVDYRGDPVPGCAIDTQIYDCNPDIEAGDIGTIGGRSGHSDKHGVFKMVLAWRLGEKRATFLVFTASRDGYAEGPPVGVKVATGATVEVLLTLALPARIVGMVTDAAGVGLGDVAVTLGQRTARNAEWPAYAVVFPPYFNAKTDASGGFTLEGVRAGEYGISVNRAGYRPKSGPRTIAVEPGETRALPENLVMAAAPVISFDIVSPDTRTAADIVQVDVLVYDDKGGRVASVLMSRRNGRFAGEVVVSGVFKVQVKRKDGGLIAEFAEVKLADGETTDLGDINVPDAG